MSWDSSSLNRSACWTRSGPSWRPRSTGTNGRWEIWCSGTTAPPCIAATHSTARRAASCIARRSKARARQGGRPDRALRDSGIRSRLRVLQRLERLRDQTGTAIELALRFGIVSGLGAALDIGEQIAERLGAELVACALQRMSGAHGAGGIAAGDVIGECRAEARQITFQLTDEPGKHVIPSGGALNAPDLIDEGAIEQHRVRREKVVQGRASDDCSAFGALFFFFSSGFCSGVSSGRSISITSARGALSPFLNPVLRMRR